MSKQKQNDGGESIPPPRLYLVTPPLDDADTFAPVLAAVLATGFVEAVLLKAEAGALKRIVPVLAPIIQGANAALLVDCPDDARLAARLGVDGVHVSGGEAQLAHAIESLKPERIVGVGGLTARHDAMEAGEKDIDYVMFGEPREDGTVPPIAAVVDRVRWWAEIFTLPCVAYADSAEAVADLMHTGADFLALGPFVFSGAEAPEACLSTLHAQLHQKRAA